MHTKPRALRHFVVAITAGASVLVPAAPAAAERGPITDVEAVRAGLDGIVGADRVPGALAEVRDRRGRSVTVTSGTAEAGTDLPMVDGDGRFRIASVTKTFVAVAVLRLVARDQVRLDAPIEAYLPGVVRGTGAGSAIDGRDITVRQLLQNTSGLPDYVEHLDLTGPVEAADLLRLALSHEPDFAPGQGWRYSNTGFIVAGMLVERLTHQDIGTAVTELAIRPAHLTDTYWPPAGERAIRGPHARNYAVDEADPAGPLVDVTEFEPSWAGASGAMVSTPSDLNRFWQELLGGRLLPRRALAEMQALVPAPELGPGAAYGLGVVRLPLPCGGHAWAHGGDLGGGGVATVSGRDDSGRAATVYITALTGGTGVDRMLGTFHAALCA
ncbi:beta-lactamase family protein [Saccharothrix sp. S26]|uniref:serine hydrolase domain-containing protein n=1 Tax=Saccharothrix sp. S26 TaxID=2907215 RepID=UPI001F284BE1|nr:serine hydrolase domain-containing protein [Saccharothrix sp. S26]MCE6994326.1 beta-lactamase family protein [Saccharothrix sp. S26]